jgi:hypothetical protein
MKGFDEPTVMLVFFVVAALVTWVRLRNALRGFGVNLVLCLLTTALGQTPSFFFVASFAAVLFQHGLPIWAAILATLPALALASTRVLPTLNLMWTFLSLTCAFHATLHAGLSEDEVGNYVELARKKGITGAMYLGVLMSAFGWIPVVLPLPTLLGYIAVRYAWPHFHTLGAKFVE